MKHFSLDVDEHLFNLLWRALAAREQELTDTMRAADETDAALVANDLVYLRLCKKDLEGRAREQGFSEGVFVLDDGYIDLTTL